jgi:hypothetical protein
MSAMALSRVAAHAVEFGPDGENLTPVRGSARKCRRICGHLTGGSTRWPAFFAIVLWAFTAAGNDRFTVVVDQAGWPGRSAPGGPIAGRYRARMMRRSGWSWTTSTR